MTTGEVANFLMGGALAAAYFTAFPAPSKRWGFLVAGIFACAAFVIPAAW